MRRERTYLDWNATAPLRPEARSAMLAAMELTGNPSSVHAEGRQSRALVERARRDVAALVSARADDVYFTSGATEANNWVLRGGWDTILYCGIEHDSVRAPAEASGARLIVLAATRDGLVDADAAASAIAEAGRLPGKALLALQAANNETGVVQPAPHLAKLAREHGVAVLCDAVQAAGRVPVSLDQLEADYVALSAHKLGGPKGVGAMVVRPATDLQPLVVGGGQERRQRAGTENVAAIAGFGAAAIAALSELESAAARMAAFRTRLETRIAQSAPSAVIIGAAVERLPNTTTVALPGRRAEVLVAGLDLAGVAVSAGAACSSGKVGRSATLVAMGLSDDIADSAIRVSLGPTTTEADITAFLAAWSALAGAHLRAA